ncbi:MAG: DUF4445 domain-containing protein [Pirellulales bacterium]|nr:DUF4445 domain-containing protein [Pirellulales bacterium]
MSVRFQPSGRTFYVLRGTRILEAAAAAGLVVETPCGGEGLCGKCRVLVHEHPAEPTPAERQIFSVEELRQGWRLACQGVIAGPVTIEIPAESLTGTAHQILTHTEQKVVVLPEDRTAGDVALAVDLGTTTLAAALLDSATGAELAVAARLNPQSRYGDDVLSRIAFARDQADGPTTLQQAVLEAVNQLLDELCRQSGVAAETIQTAALAGNTAMQHLFCGLDSRGLGEVPFTPAVSERLLLPAGPLGLRIRPEGRAYVFPVIGGFVGGDIVAGILASELTETPGPTLFVDIGTNGEIVLWADGKLTAASTAAGPAFEGARISCGMRGSAGAIEKVVVDGRLRLNVIGDTPPCGLCGSGLIDLAAELLRHGLLSPLGKLLTPDQFPADVPPDLGRRIILHEGKVAFLLADAEDSATGRPLVLTQRDLRELQLATGAIRAGITILLRRSGLAPGDLDEVFLAGGFGNFIRRSNAQRIGLLPHEIEHHRIRYRGNTALSGAAAAALSLAAQEEAERLARQTEHVNLSADPAFRDTFADSMIFPEG